LRGLTRTFGVSRNTVTAWLKKSEEAAEVQHHAARTRRRKA
jgi:transposase